MNNDSGNILPFCLFIFILGFFGFMALDIAQEESKDKQTIQDYADVNHPLKELTVEKITTKEIKGEFLLIWGSVYGRITEEKYISLLYGSKINGEMVYRPISIPMAQAEFVTISSNTSPYLRILLQSLDSVECGNPDFDNCDELNIKRVRLYLPDGWKILSESNKNLTTSME